MGQNSGLLSSLTDWNSTLAGYAGSISTGVVMPVALTLLALFMILELYNATQRIAMNGSSNAFTIQQIALVMMKIVVCRWAVLHTTEILNALFEIASTVTTGISGYVGSGEVNTTVDIENAIAALPGGIGNMPVALELMVVGWMLRIVNIVVNTIVAARFIELYVYNAMASLSIATLCYQELHGIAVNFLKSYLAVALQGAVLYLVIGFYPALAGSLGTGGSITEQAWAMLGQSVILLVAVFMSGKFTKAIFVNDGIWTMDGDGEVRLTIMASIAQDESRKTSERVKAGQKMSREKGVLYGSGNIIGYDRVDGTYVINEEQAATVRRIFNLYAEGHGETTVAKMLIEENRKDGGGGLSWTASKVSRVLRKPTYKGYMTYNKSHIDDFLSHNRINHSEEDFVLVKGNFEPIVSEELWETCNQIRSKRAAFVKGKDGRAHKFGVSFPQNKWTKILFCDCGMRFQIEGYDKTANGGKNMRLICARSKMFKKKDAARALNGIPCPAPYASEWKLELMAREVFRTVWKENAEDILGLLRMLDANLNTTGTPNDGNQLENKLSALNKELDDLVSQRASRSITMDDFLSKSTEINNEIINVEGLLQSSIQEQRPKARLDMHSIEAALSDDASFPDGKIEPGFLDRYANRIVKSNNRYIWMLQLMNVQQIMPIQSERQPIAMVTYKSGVPYDIEQEQIGKQDKESAGLDCATICRPQDFFLNMGRTTRKRKLVEWLESCQENQVSVLDEKIPLLSFAVDFVTAYEYQKARGIKIHPGLWKDMRVDIFLVKKEN